MTRIKFLALLIAPNTGNSYRTYYRQPAVGGNYRVFLQSGEEPATGDVVLYTTPTLSKAVDADNRYNMWLAQAGRLRTVVAA